MRAWGFSVNGDYLPADGQRVMATVGYWNPRDRAWWTTPRRATYRDGTWYEDGNLLARDSFDYRVVAWYPLDQRVGEDHRFPSCDFDATAENQEWPRFHPER